MCLPRVVCEVEQLRLALAVAYRVFDQLVGAVLDGSLRGDIGEIERVPYGLLPIVHGTNQAFAFDAGRLRCPRQFAQRREDVVEVDVGLTPLRFGDTGSGEDERDADAVLVAVLLAHQSVLADSQAVVTGQHDHRIVGETLLVQGVEHPPELVVEMADHGVVLGDVPANLLGLPGESGKQLVADA